MPVAFLRPPSSSCFPSRVRLVRSAPPPRYGAPPLGSVALGAALENQVISRFP